MECLDDENVTCVFCNGDLNDISIDAREKHVQMCVASQNLLSSQMHSLDEECDDMAEECGLQKSNFYCVICDLNLGRRSLLNRCKHMKKCAKTYNVGTKELIQLLSGDALSDEESESEDHDDHDLGNNNVTGCVSSLGPNKELIAIDVDSSDSDDDVVFVSSSADPPSTGSVPLDTSVHTSSSSSSTRNAFQVLMNGSRSVAVSERSECDKLARLPSVKDNAFNHMMAASHSTSTTPSSSSAAAKLQQQKRNFSSLQQGTKLPSESKRGNSSWSSNWNRKKPPTTDRDGRAYAPNYKKIQLDQNQQLPIIVDGFQYANSDLSDCYFLTHFHSDHYIGLDGNFDYGRIYCSPTTASLVKLKLKLKSSKTNVVIIAIENEIKTMISVGGVKVAVTFMDANHCPGAVCILFEFANGKKALHTGDFRWCNSLTAGSPTYRSLVHKANALGDMKNKQLVAYLDTTYCHPSHQFPKQQHAIDAVLSCVNADIQEQKKSFEQKCAMQHSLGITEVKPFSSHHTIYVFGAYGIGKEKVFMAVAKYLNMKWLLKCSVCSVTVGVNGEIAAGFSSLYFDIIHRIGSLNELTNGWWSISSSSKTVYVDGSRYKTMCCYADWTTNDKALLTTNPQDTCVWVVGMAQINFNYISQIRTSGGGRTGGKGGSDESKKVSGCSRIVAFQPTGWSYRGGTTVSPNSSSSSKSSPGAVLCTPRHKGPDTIYSIPYSEHSSFTELLDFMHLFKPHRVVPTVNTAIDKVNDQLELLKTHSLSQCDDHVPASTAEYGAVGMQSSDSANIKKSSEFV